MIKTLAIPVLNRGDLLQRCLLSVDHPFENLVIINNGNDGKVASVASHAKDRHYENMGLFENIFVEKHKNLGCGPSWNHVMRTYPGPWMFAGNDVQFNPGSIALVDACHDEHPDACLICADGYSVFCMTEAGTKKIGFFDENFYPAYFEDSDHFRRVHLCGAKAVGVPRFTYVHGEAPYWGSSTVKSDPNIDSKNAITFQNLQDYYTRKWGGAPAHETFRTPFNKPVGVEWWELEPDLRSKNSLW